MNYAETSLKKHYEWKGKIEVSQRATVKSREDLSLAYTPGVAAPCLEIQKDESKSYELTRRWNTVAVITDGTAIVLGAALMNALKVVKKEIGAVRVVINGAGSAGVAIARVSPSSSWTRAFLHATAA